MTGPRRRHPGRRPLPAAAHACAARPAPSPADTVRTGAAHPVPPNFRTEERPS